MTAAIRCRNLEKLYPPDVRAVDGLDLEVEEGECFGLLGPNGAGKTTTVEILEGLLEPTAGEVEVLGHDWRGGAQKIRQSIGISLQETRFAEKLSVRETVILFRSFYADGLDPDGVIRSIGLDEKASSWVGKLSGGQQKRLEIACALVGRPALLFLDEPTTGLDPGSRRQLWEIIRTLRSEGRTVLLTTHYMDEAERLCDRVAVIDHGKMIALGSPGELISSLGGDHVIEFATQEGDAWEDDEQHALSGLPGVRELRAENGNVSLTVSEPHVAIPALLGELEKRGRHLKRLLTRHASLEDVFVKLTGRHFDESDG
ncbi:MAG: ABC transporter ATP-binding protein [Planctomycetota bacterium]|nr:ABC transporter ATP-binding protein [Planctomycetota bacterium]